MPQQGLFRKRGEPEPQPDSRLFELARRSRTLEERYSSLERRNQVMEENVLEHNRKLSSEIRLMNDDIRELKKGVSELTEKMHYLAAELQDFARRDEVQVIKKYLDYWEPMRFVTHDQVEKIINEIIDEKKEK